MWFHEHHTPQTPANQHGTTIKMAPRTPHQLHEFFQMKQQSEYISISEVMLLA